MPSTVSAALPDLQLKNRSLKAELRSNSSQPSQGAEIAPEIIAAAIFDDACTGSGLTNASVAVDLQVSESLVSRWRSPHHREFPSLLQLQRLGPDFLVALTRATSRHNGLGRRAIGALLDAVGDLAVAVGE